MDKDYVNIIINKLVIVYSVLFKKHKNIFLEIKVMKIENKINIERKILVIIN